MTSFSRAIPISHTGGSQAVRRCASSCADAGHEPLVPGQGSFVLIPAAREFTVSSLELLPPGRLHRTDRARRWRDQVGAPDGRRPDALVRTRFAGCCPAGRLLPHLLMMRGEARLGVDPVSWTPFPLSRRCSHAGTSTAVSGGVSETAGRAGPVGRTPEQLSREFEPTARAIATGFVRPPVMAAGETMPFRRSSGRN